MPIDHQGTLGLGGDSQAQAGHCLARLVHHAVEALRRRIKPPSRNFDRGLDRGPPPKEDDRLLLHRSRGKGGPAGWGKELRHHITGESASSVDPSASAASYSTTERGPTAQPGPTVTVDI